MYTMNYLEINIQQVPEQQELIMPLLLEQGAEAFEETDTALKAFFPATNFNRQAVEQILAEKELVYTIEELPQQNWNAVWESNFSPVIVNNFVAVRAHFHAVIPDVQHQILITPKMSFGTGHHATTFMVMELMETVDFNNKTVFDFGTGTGILAILAEKLGAAKVVGVDNDDWCIENGLENMAANQCSKTTIVKANSAKAKESYQIVLANINRHILLENLKIFPCITSANGTLIISGLLLEDEKEMIIAFESVGFQHVITKSRGQWIAIQFSC
jgi:ribosomal protein L11 methyltransferase